MLISMQGFQARHDMATTTNPDSIVVPHDSHWNSKEAKQLVKASGEINTIIISDYIRMARVAIIVYA
jgi:hypothetical protein